MVPFFDLFTFLQPAQGICQKCHKKPVGHRAGPAPQAFCPACAETAAQCEVCKKPLQAQKHGHGWCFDCAFPPCNGGCGTPRPATHYEYHAKKLPQWTCQACLQVNKPESKQPKSHADAEASSTAPANEPPPPLPPPQDPPDGYTPTRRKRTLHTQAMNATVANPVLSVPVESNNLVDAPLPSMPPVDPPTHPAVPDGAAGQPKKRRRLVHSPPQTLMTSLPAEMPDDV